ncbi:MAG TPA: FHA domain-containing serine/threonine-protein kinase [Thermoanaerobaculia bacterium]|nr:FHA domain-containing serine/threonine-protein kinase [Thermoanaerobaculia bacterium]
MIGSEIGNYRVERELSEGGMSHVYVGRTTRVTDVLPENFAVVLKVMSDELVGEETARKRFEKEAYILSRLRHRNITRFYEFIPRESGAVLVMEFVEGQPLDQMIAQKGALDVADATRIASHLLDALVYAHAKGIVHRDIKPANLICQASGNVKVTDFGIAKIKEGGSSGDTALTKSGLLLGTPHYMSPEQIREPKDAGAKSDVYSTGVLLYEMLTGTLPYSANSLRKLIDAIYRGGLKPPSAIRHELDPDIDSIVLKAMATDQQTRYESALDFLEALANYITTPRKRERIVEIDPNDATMRADAGPGRWQLISRRSEGKEEVHAVERDDVTVGRDRSCSIVISHPAVSRRHAKISTVGRLLALEDLKSANGTFVNNVRVERADLKPGDVVRFGADPNCSFLVSHSA